jgi:hypothetical protein
MHDFFDDVDHARRRVLLGGPALASLALAAPLVIGRDLMEL